MFICNIVSQTSISLENRFKMRPIGVVSKYDIGARRTLFNISLCNNLDPNKVDIATVIVSAKENAASPTPKAA